MKNPEDSKRLEARIAILEESAENIYSMKFILQSLGYQVHACAAAEGYLKDLLEFQPAVVLVDMLMPHGAGLVLISEVRQSPLKNVAIVAVTAEAVPVSEEQLRSAGVNDILTKPYTVADLQKSLNQVYRGRPSKEPQPVHRQLTSRTDLGVTTKPPTTPS